MRNTFVQALVESAKGDPTISLVVGDLGYGVVEGFQREFGPRFLNAGVAEQNMTGVAVGMAMTGMKVFTYSIANFPTLRCLEQIRNDVCYHGVDVTVVAVGGGLGYGSLGYSHHAVQDIACLRGMPGMTLLLPGSPAEVKAVTRWKLRHPGPAYLRLGKGGEPDVGDTDVLIADPGLRLVIPGRDVAMISVGSSLGWAAPWAISAGHALYSIPVWADSQVARESVLECVDDYRRTVVIEEHLPSGGVGSLVREVLEVAPSLQAKVRCLGLHPRVCGQVGSADYLRSLGGLTSENYRHAVA